MASSQLTSTATAVSTSIENVPAAKENESEIQNDPDFAIICAFLQKFAKELAIDVPSFGQLNEWLISTDEVSTNLRDMHIKLLRKTRKTVHEKSWESALSKFCFSYSAQDAWEIERFGYKRSSFKVKLRILRELLESQFDRNNKFRTKLLTLSADSLRSQPIGRDKLGHTYWLTQDDDCNLRIYQEHLDEEIWRVVATNREELVNLIARLRGNEVVLPSADIGIVDEDTSSSNSCVAPIERPPPPEEQDDSQEEPAIKVPNLRIRLGANKNKPDQEECLNTVQYGNSIEEGKSKTRNILKNDTEENIEESTNESTKKVKPLIISHRGTNSPSISTGSKRRNNNEEDSILSPPKEEHIVKRWRPSLLDSRRSTKPNKYFKSDEEECSSLDGESDDEEAEEEDIDSVAAEEDDNEEKDIEEYDDDFEGEVSEEIEDPIVHIQGSGSGHDCDAGKSIQCPDDPDMFLSAFEIDEYLSFSDIIEETLLVISGEGNGHDCLVGNKNEESPTKSNEPKATFFFGEPGCLKLSPIKLNPSSAESNKPEKETIKSCNSNSEKKGDGEVEAKSNKYSSAKGNDDTISKAEIQQSEINGEKIDTLKENASKIDCNRKVSENEIKELQDPKSTKIFKDLEEKDVIRNNENKNFISNEPVKDENTNMSKDAETSKQIIPDLNEKTSQTKTRHDSTLSTSAPKCLKAVMTKVPQTNTVSEKDVEDIAQSTQSLVNTKTNAQMSFDHSKFNVVHKNSPLFAKPAHENVALNRKRRLSDFQTLSQPIRSASDSDLDPNTDRPDEPAAVDEILDDIGGKRLKMRTKCPNIEVRKKIEAKLDANLEETTSSSGDEESKSPRKICSGKKETQKVSVKKIDEPASPNQIDKLDMKTSPQEDLKNNINASTSSTSIGQIKQKLTLSEVVEKKLKKSALKSKEDSLSIKEKTVPLKKSPITKPLKKNLLTQLRESDEEAVPRKRPLSNAETVSKSSDLTVDINQEVKEQTQITEIKESFIEKITLQTKPSEHEMIENCTVPRKNSERKRQNSEEPLIEKTTSLEVNEGSNGDSNDNSNDNVKKSRDTLEVKSKMEKKNSSHMDTVACHSLVDINDPEDDKQVAVKEEIVENALAVNRRSSRRSGPTLYTELPQSKRTRAGNKSATKLNTDKEQKTTEKIKIEKSESVVLIKSETAVDLKNSLENQRADDQIKNERLDEVSSKPVTDNGSSVEKVNLPNSVDTIEDQIKVNFLQKSEETSHTSLTFGSGSGTGSGSGPGRGRGPRKKREVDTKNIIDEETDAPVRQSRRIAQQKIREEAERRKLEEIALRTMKQELKKKKKAEKEADPTVVEPSEHSSLSSDSEVETKKKSKKKCPGKDGWSSGSEEVEEPEEEDEYPHHYESDAGSPLFKSDHEFSPESDLEDETQVVPMKRARTARKEDAEDDHAGDEEACQKCGKSDHPEWILLCDICDKGYHCSCLTPVLFYIPEGDWYCPPCQQEQLIVALEKQLQEFDELVEKKRIAHEEEKRLAELAEREEQARLKEEEEHRRERRKQKHKKRHRNESSDGGSSFDSDKTGKTDSEGVAENGENSKKHNIKDDDSDDDSKTLQSNKRGAVNVDKSKGRHGEGRNRRRRAAARGARRRRRLDKASSSASSFSGNSSNSSSLSRSGSTSGSFSDSDDEPIYKLRKRRQINVSYRLNEYDDLINSALKKEMDEVAGAGNAGRGKDITTIIEADKEEKARLKQIEEKENCETGADEDRKKSNESSNEEDRKKPIEKQDDSDDEKPLKNKSKPMPTIKKKSRKLTTLDISSEEDDESDEDFKTSSFDDDEEDEDTSNTASTDSDTSLEIFRRKGKSGKKKQRKAARRAARERRKVKKFVVDDSDDEEENVKTKKKRNNDSDYTESETDDNDELSELSENIDSAELCDDTTSEESDGAWHPSKKKKKRKSSGVQVGQNSEKSKKVQTKRPKQLEYSDDDISETEDEEDDDDDDGVGGGKGSGKQPRSQPLIPVNSNKSSNSGKKGKPAASAKKKQKKRQSEEDLSFSDSGDSTRRTRGRRYAYLEDFEDDSSDGGIKPGVKRPDTPPEEREKFIKKQEEIKRMLAEKNAEGAKLAATPRLTPIKALGGGISSEKDKRSPVKIGQDSLSTVPLSVIRQAKVLDIDYLQRKGESIGDLDNPDEVDSEFDDADLPDDLPEDMDEDAIARMVEEEEEFGAAATTRDLPVPDEVVRSPNKSKNKEPTISMQKAPTNSSLEALSQMQSGTPNVSISVAPTTISGLQEPTRKRLPMPTLHPPLLRHQYPHSPHTQSGNIMLHGITMPRHPPPTHLLQNALSAPLGQPLNRNLPIHAHNANASIPARSHLPPTRTIQGERSTVPGGPSVSTIPIEGDIKPRGRRKKITPLRDPMQKQAASSSGSALNVQGDKTISGSRASTVVVSSSNSGGSNNTSSVIKTPASTLPVSQPPHLYKAQSDAIVVSETQTSVITRLPLVSPSRMIFPGADVARFYNTLPSAGAAGAPRQLTPNAQRPHRGSPLHMPPVLPQSISAPSYVPSHARHAPSHLNPYRPPIYGNPSFIQTRPLPSTAVNMRLGSAPSTGTEYLGGPRPFPPYNYYPPPPPLTTTHHSTPPNSVIVAAPPATSSTAPPVANLSTQTTSTHATVHSQQVSSDNLKSTPPDDMTTSNKSATEPTKKLMTLDVYTSSNEKSPLGIGGGESSGSQPEAAEDSSPSGLQSQAKAGEFSGLVSYFSSQHDDYNT